MKDWAEKVYVSNSDAGPVRDLSHASGKSRILSVLIVDDEPLIRWSLRRLKDDLARPFGFDSIISDSEPMQCVKTLARKVAQSPASTVLITGESGTGKDLLADISVRA